MFTLSAVLMKSGKPLSRFNLSSLHRGRRHRPSHAARLSGSSRRVAVKRQRSIKAPTAKGLHRMATAPRSDHRDLLNPARNEWTHGMPSLRWKESREQPSMDESCRACATLAKFTEAPQGPAEDASLPKRSVHHRA